MRWSQVHPQLWHFQLHRMETENPKSSNFWNNTFSTRVRNIRKLIGSFQKVDWGLAEFTNVPGTAEAGGCGYPAWASSLSHLFGKWTPLRNGWEPQIVSLEKRDMHRTMYQTRIPLTFNFRGSTPPTNAALISSCFSLHSEFWISFANSLLTPVPSSGRASGGLREGLWGVFSDLTRGWISTLQREAANHIRLKNHCKYIWQQLKAPDRGVCMCLCVFERNRESVCACILALLPW